MMKSLLISWSLIRLTATSSTTLLFSGFMSALMFFFSLNPTSVPYSSPLFLQDSLTLNLLTLSWWITFLTLAASPLNLSHTMKTVPYLFFITFLLTVLILCFSCKHLITFYIAFELTLLPMLFMILGWGYQPERIEAGFYLLFYTVTASLPLLVCLCKCSTLMPSLAFTIFSPISPLPSFLLIFTLLAFLVKLPMFSTHVWLPKAHVEAPVGGSMILAGILLKLGGYGILRLAPLIQQSFNMFHWIWLPLSLTGGALISILCVAQTDLKALIAYTSVSHMALVCGSALSFSPYAINSSMSMMIAHGLSSSGLFYAAYIMYLRSTSRSMHLNKSFLSFLPSFTLFFFLLSLANMAAPPTLNLLSEISILLNLISISLSVIPSLALMMFFSMVYSLYLFASSQYGKPSLLNFPPYPLTPMETLTLFNHSFPLFIMLPTVSMWS